MKYTAPKGFSLIEIVITVGLLATFLGFITLNLVSNQRRNSLSATVETLVADLRLQQMKAIGGATDGSGTPDDYGVYFTADAYTLFRGSSYSALNTSNFTVTLDPQFVFSPPNTSLIFSRVTGKVRGFDSSEDSITIGDEQSGIQKVLQYNQYGIPISLN